MDIFAWSTCVYTEIFLGKTAFNVLDFWTLLIAEIIQTPRERLLMGENLPPLREHSLLSGGDGLAPRFVTQKKDSR